MKNYIIMSLLTFAFYSKAYCDEFDRLIFTGNVSSSNISEGDISNTDIMGEPLERHFYGIGQKDGKHRLVEGKIETKKWIDKKNENEDQREFIFKPFVSDVKVVSKYLIVGKTKREEVSVYNWETECKAPVSLETYLRRIFPAPTKGEGNVEETDDYEYNNYLKEFDKFKCRIKTENDYFEVESMDFNKLTSESDTDISLVLRSKNTGKRIITPSFHKQPFIGDLNGDDVPDFIYLMYERGRAKNGVLYLSNPQKEESHIIKFNIVQGFSDGGC